MLIGDWILRLDSGEVINVHDHQRKKNLTSKLLLFVNTLIEGNGEVVPKAQIVDKVWGGYTSPENITQVINKLRVIFDDVEKNLFVNHPSIGYSLNFSSYSHLERMIDDKGKSLINENNGMMVNEGIGLNPSSSNLSWYARYLWVFPVVFSLFIVFKEEYTEIKVKESKDSLAKVADFSICNYKCYLRDDDEKLYCE
ncbi:winged helix-turn-helix domain-containing protein [Vibrio owensii]|uniref:winged helix-turn-helix domain-containing protein n=1 Tax=Vibrio owensii TaxID=696485 RepID=UPI0015CFD6CB|nr:winged helix-turn-helix domain-containing protein [Vibrio owensii]